MNAEIEHKVKRNAIFVFVAGFVLSLVFSIIDKNSDEMLWGMAITFVIAMIAFYVTKSVMKSKVQFTTAQWVFYVWGWITGAGNLLFWLIVAALHEMNNYGEPFFGKDFHRRVEIWGKVQAVLFVIGLITILAVLFFDKSSI